MTEATAAQTHPGEWRYVETGPTMGVEEMLGIFEKCGVGPPQPRTAEQAVVLALRCIDALERRIRAMEATQRAHGCPQIMAGRETD